MSEDHVKLKKAVRLLNQRGLDGLIIYSNGTLNVLRPNYLYHFSECRPFGPNSAAVVSKSGEVTLLVEPEWDIARVSSKTWIRNTRGTSDFAGALAGLMEEMGVAGSVGVAGSGQMTADLYGSVKGGADIALADDLMEETARGKSERELDAARKGGVAADAGFGAFLRHARVGIREYELIGETEFAMRSAGADDNFNLLSSGRHNYAMHSPTDRRLAEGDILIGEISSVCEGQVVQLCKTVVLGEPGPVLREKYQMLLRALDESLGEVKAGNPASSISRAMNGVISEAGYAKYCYPPYMRARGHGFGVGSVAPGTAIDDDTEQRFEKDQVVVVHPNQYIPEAGYLACGETVLVTETGMERLSKTENKLYVKGV